MRNASADRSNALDAAINTPNRSRGVARDAHASFATAATAPSRDLMRVVPREATNVGAESKGVRGGVERRRGVCVGIESEGWAERHVRTRLSAAARRRRARDALRRASTRSSKI
eukprot:4377-Pelagococcus_subviridis.AAC.1